MNPGSPQPPQSLDAEERALARSLPRLQGRTAPGPDLDAHILAAAQAAVHPAIRARPQVRWIAPAALAASVMLAVGMAWHLRPLPAPDAGLSTARAAEDAASALPADPASTVAGESSPASDQATAPQPAESTAPVVTAPAASPRQAAPTGENPAPLPPPAPPAPPVPDAAPAAVPQATGRAGATVMSSPTPLASSERMAPEAPPVSSARDRAADSARQPEPDAARMKASSAPPRNEAAMAADAGFVDDPGEDIPPATVDAPAVRAAWLQRIDTLLQQGRVDEARDSLAEFRRRYPQAVLPGALQDLADENPAGRSPPPR